MKMSHQLLSDAPVLHPLLFVLLLGLVGCDAFGEEQTIVLTDTELSFQYRFDGADLSPSETSELTSVNTVDVNLSAVLREDGFTLRDLRSITLERATLDITFPLRQNLDFLEHVEIYLDAEELSPTLVAERRQIPDGQGQITVPVESKDLEAYVRVPLTSHLHLGIDREVPERQFEMDVTLQLAIEVGGL